MRSIRLTIASTRPRVSQGGLGSRPAKNMLYSASSRFSSASSTCSSRSISVTDSGTTNILWRFDLQRDDGRAPVRDDLRLSAVDAREIPRERLHVLPLPRHHLHTEYVFLRYRLIPCVKNG